MPIMLSTNERELYLMDPLFHRLVDSLVALAIEHPAYAAEDGRRLGEAVNAARAILEERQQLRDRTDGYLAGRRPGQGPGPDGAATARPGHPARGCTAQH